MKYPETALKIYQEELINGKADTEQLLNLDDFHITFEIFIDRILASRDEITKHSIKTHTLSIFKTACSISKGDSFYAVLNSLVLSFLAAYKFCRCGIKKNRLMMPTELANELIRTEDFYIREVNEDEAIVRERKTLRENQSYFEEKIQLLQEELKELQIRKEKLESSNEDHETEIAYLNNEISDSLSELNFAIKIKYDEEAYKKEQDHIIADLEQAKSKQRLYKSLLDIEESISKPEFSEKEFQFLKLIGFKIHLSPEQYKEFVERYCEDAEFIDYISTSLKGEEEPEQQIEETSYQAIQKNLGVIETSQEEKSIQDLMLERAQQTTKYSLRHIKRRNPHYREADCIGCEKEKIPRLIS